MALFWLSDEAWAAIEPHLPKNQPGARRVDDRRVISGILHVLKAGCRWCDCPTDYGPTTTVYNRFNRWSRRGFWLKLLEALVDAGAATKSTAIDSTYVKAQRGAFGAVNGAAIFLRSGAAKFPSLAGWRSAVGVIGASVFWRPAAAFQGRGNGIGGGVRLEADRFGQEVGVLAQPIARAFDLDDDGVVKKPVEEGGGDDGIAEDLAPLGESAV